MGIKITKKGGWKFDTALKELKQKKSKLPKLIANEIKNFVLKSWDNESFSDKYNKSDPWKKRKRQTSADKRTGKRRGLLVQSGALRRSIRVGVATWNKIEVGSYGVKYAQYHNRGTSRLPKRQFVGKSRVLNDKISKLIKKEIGKNIFK